MYVSLMSMIYKYRIPAILITAALAATGFQLGTALPAGVEAQVTSPTAPSQLVLKVSDYETPTGQIAVALFRNEASFEAETPYRDAVVKISGPTTTIIFDDLPVGEYAFKLFHDANMNGELDTDGLGIPSEDYFFSTDASDPFSAPEFDESKFILPKGKMVRNISLD